MEIVDSIRQIISDFEFARVARIQRIKLETRDIGIFISCEFLYFNGARLHIAFLNAWNVRIVFDGGDMQLGEFFVAPLMSGRGYRIWDELTGLSWKCDTILLVSISQP